MLINFFFNDIFIKIANRKRLRVKIMEIFDSGETPLQSLTYVFCTDNYLLSINREFLNHDSFTDIVTFSLAEQSDPIIGEVYISVQRIKDNASIFGVSINEELHRLMFHGALHLCGYKDKTPSDKIKMTLAEEHWLKSYFL
ncbi:MAG: rRNA maturation RNase YbeY [Ferruginibacter sp.]|nr:rRNA maturation RNase YbeY [Ferruginibacter sp.]